MTDNITLFCLKCERPYEAKDEQTPCPTCGSEGAKPGLPKSVLVIEFAAPASTQFNMTPHGIVTREQLVVVGNFLLTRARAIQMFEDQQAIIKQLMEEEKQESERPQIVVPGMSPEVVAEIARAARGK